MWKENNYVNRLFNHTTHPTRQQREHSLLKVLDGEVFPLVPVDFPIVMETHYDEGAQLFALFKQVNVTDVKQIKGPRHIHYCVVRLQREKQNISIAN